VNAAVGAWAFADALAVAASILIYVLTTRAAQYRRPPSIAIAWVLGMIAVPYLVLPAYLLFGRRKLRRKSAQLRAPRGQSRHWAENLIESFDLPAASPCRVRLHRDGVESRAALFETISSATLRLDVGTYLIGKDAFGREAAARLAARARAGVRVRLLIDGVGAIQLPRSAFRALHAAGVETAVFSPLFARTTAGSRNLRNHRKYAIADAALLWTGGRNLAAEYFTGAGGAPPWRDLSFDLRGRVAETAARQFETDWVASRGEPGAPLPDCGDAIEGDPAQFLPSGPDQTEDTVQALLLDAAFHAERRLLAVTPYFVPDSALEGAIRLAARRGVAVDIYLPERSNHRLADFARSRSLRALTDAGVAFHLLPHMVHAKAVVFDSSLALCGSVNLDSRSLLLNYESAVIFYGRREIDWLAAWIQALAADAHSYRKRRPSLWRDLGEGLLLTLAYQL